jgi:hypothetical protein
MIENVDKSSIDEVVAYTKGLGMLLIQQSRSRAYHA